MSSVTALRIKEIYDARADIPFDGSTNSQEVTAAIDLLVDHVPSRSSRICDVGCGAGWHLKEMSRRGYDCLFGIDLSPTNLLSTNVDNRADDALLAQGDVADWGVQGFFDVVLNFNSCLGAFDRQHDAIFLAGVRRILRNHGLLILTYTSREVAEQRVGNFRVLYDRSSSTEVHSTVSFDNRLGRLLIEQRVNDTFLPHECFDVYSEAEMQSLLEGSGFYMMQNLRTSRIWNDDGPLRFLSGVIACKKPL